MLGIYLGRWLRQRENVLVAGLIAPTLAVLDCLIVGVRTLAACAVLTDLSGILERQIVRGEWFADSTGGA